jgi:hypothetical protein
MLRIAKVLTVALHLAAVAGATSSVGIAARLDGNADPRQRHCEQEVTNSYENR